MSLLNKLLGIVSIPAGLWIILEKIGIFTILPIFDKVLIGAILAFAVQTLSLIMAHSHGESIGEKGSHLRIINIIMFLVLVTPSVLYGLNYVMTFSFAEYIPIMVGAILVIEGLYSLH